MSKDHVILVAFQLSGDEVTRGEAQEILLSVLPEPGTQRFVDLTGKRATLECWWEAEDDRIDGSDCDSAVFVQPGQQAEAHRILALYDLTSAHNNPATPERGANRFEH